MTLSEVRFRNPGSSSLNFFEDDRVYCAMYEAVEEG
jgi:hypothetical protein